MFICDSNVSKLLGTFIVMQDFFRLGHNRKGKTKLV